MNEYFYSGFYHLGDQDSPMSGFILGKDTAIDAFTAAEVELDKAYGEDGWHLVMFNKC